MWATTLTSTKRRKLSQTVQMGRPLLILIATCATERAVRCPPHWRQLASSATLSRFLHGTRRFLRRPFPFPNALTGHASPDGEAGLAPLH